MCMNTKTISGITANIHSLISAVHFCRRALFPPLLIDAFYKISFTRMKIIHQDFFIVQKNKGIGSGIVDLIPPQPFFEKNKRGGGRPISIFLLQKKILFMIKIAEMYFFTFSKSKGTEFRSNTIQELDYFCSRGIPIIAAWQKNKLLV